ncbi:hypothetical protein D3C72_1364780 [compost metagenome]
MDMNRAVGQRQQRAQLVAGHRAQAVRGDAKHRIGQRGQRGTGIIEQLCEPVYVMDEAALCRVRRRPTEIGVGVEHRQQGQADAGLPGRSSNLHAHLGAIGVGAAIGIVVQVVEFADAGEAAFQHFHVGLGGDGLHCIRAQMGQEAVHQFTPAPETVAVAATDLGQAGHAALEGVAVQVRQARHQDGHAGIAILRCLPARDRGDAPFLHLQADIGGPAVGQQGVGGMEGVRGTRIGHGWTTRIGRLYCIDI